MSDFKVKRLIELETIPPESAADGWVYVVAGNTDYKMSGQTLVDVAAGIFEELIPSTTDSLAEGVYNLYVTPEQREKLDGIEEGAQVNLVDSVNGQTGEVVLAAADVGAEPAFSKGNIVAGTGVILSGTLTGRLVGSGNVTITATGGGGGGGSVDAIAEGAGITVDSTDPEVPIVGLTDMAQATIKGRASGAGTGAPVDLTAAQARTILNVADGATAGATWGTNLSSIPANITSWAAIDPATKLNTNAIGNVGPIAANSAGVDLDTLTTSGWQHVAAASNGSPAPGADGQLLHMESSNGDASQLAFMTSNGIYTRVQDSGPGTWGSWVQLYHSGNFATGTTAQYIRGDGSLATFPSIPAGTVTSVAAGNGLNFTTITGSGSVTLGTPTAVTLASTNSVAANSHTHAFTPGGTTAQYIRGDGSLAATNTIAASTAATLATTRTINGTSFNGSGNITTANWGTARNLTIGDTAKSVNGSANVSWSISEIGAVPTTRTISAGNGMSGGGDLSANRTVTLGTPSTIGPATTNSVTTTSHTHNLDLGTAYTWTSGHTWSYASAQLSINPTSGNGHLYFRDGASGGTHRGLLFWSRTDEQMELRTYTAAGAPETGWIVGPTGCSTTKTISDGSGNVRSTKMLAVVGSNATFPEERLNSVVEKSSTATLTWTIPPDLGTPGDMITVINSGTSGNITIARGSGVSLYRGGTNANIVVQPGNSVTFVRCTANNRWQA